MRDTMSPRKDEHRASGRPRSRSRSRSHHREGHHKRRRQDDEARDRRHEPAPVLPFNARTLSKRDLEPFRALFAMYLDVQKQILIEDLDEHELRGRWKSFINKW